MLHLDIAFWKPAILKQVSKKDICFMLYALIIYRL